MSHDMPCWCITECADVRTTLPRRFLLEQLVPHSLEASGSVQTSGRHCPGDSFWSNWSHTPWRPLGVCRRPDDIAPEIPSGATGPTLPGGLWECADVRTTLPRRFLPEQLVPHSLEASGSVQTSGRHCSGDSFRSNWSHTPWRPLGVCRCPDDIALEIPSRATGPTLPGGLWECRHPDDIAPEIPSGATGPTLPGGVWECADVQTTLLQRFLPEQLVPHSLEVSGSVQTSGQHCPGYSFRSNWSHTPWRPLGVCRHPDDIAPEIPSVATGPTLPGGLWECADVRTTLLRRFLPEQLVPHSLEVSGSVQTSG